MRQKKACVTISAAHDLQKVVFRLRIWTRTDHLPQKAREGCCQGHNAIGRVEQSAYLPPLAIGRCFYSISTLDYVRLEADRSRTTVQFQEEAAGIAQDRAYLIPAP